MITYSEEIEVVKGIRVGVGAAQSYHDDAY